MGKEEHYSIWNAMKRLSADEVYDHATSTQLKSENKMIHDNLLHFAEFLYYLQHSTILVGVVELNNDIQYFQEEIAFSIDKPETPWIMLKFTIHHVYLAKAMRSYAYSVHPS